ncbi:MAG: MMPL family transporter, partial [Flavobacteriales bacterium]|nr:MMPL family transporter [Flavobacteriales bacterium]
LILHPVPSIAAVPHENNWWRKMLPRLLLFIFKRRNALLISSGLLILLSFIGISQMRINNFLLEDLKEGNELKQHFRFFETEFSGVRPFELALQKNTGSDSLPITIGELQQIEKIENYLHQEYGAGFLFSPLSIVKTVNRSLHGGDFSAYAIPSSNEELLEIYSLLEKMKSKNAFDRVVADQGKLIRISGKSADLGSFVYKEKDAAFHSFFKEQIDTTLFSYRITGTATLIDKNNGQVARGLVYGLLLSFLVIALIVGLMYKSLSMTIIALIPNIIPLLLVAGIMGILGVDLKVSTSMIFTISFGIAVDDTIHFISKLRLELAAGKSVFYAVKRTFLTTGRAIILTTIILSGGFLTLVFSDFLGTFYLGLLIALTLIFAVLADLFLLPVLVVYFYKRK